MISVEELIISDVPVLYVCKTELRSEKCPGVIMMHGLGNDKENNLAPAYLVARKGFKVFLPDAKYHGERGNHIDNEIRKIKTLDTITTSIKELMPIKEEMVLKHHVDEDDITVGGISMGAVTTFAAMTQYDWIKRAFSLMGTPNFTSLIENTASGLTKEQLALFPPLEELKQQVAGIDLSRKIEVVNGREIFAWHGEDDTVVNVDGILQFENEIKAFNPNQKIEVVIESNRGHKISRKCMLSLLQWFDKKSSDMTHSTLNKV